MGKPQKTYSSVGVDTDIEAKAARIMYEASKKTWVNRKGTLGEVILPFDDFAGLRFVRADNLPKGTVMYGGSDGVATKAELAERAGKFDTLAYDLIAMVCDDAVIRGGEPVLLKSVLDVNTLGTDDSRLQYIEQLAKGYVDAAKIANVAIINGELAQLNDRIGDMENFHLEWSADVTWFAHESRLITGYDVRPGDSIVAFEEPGLRCNGISLVRKILREEYGENWENEKLDGEKLIDLALLPSLIYSPIVNEIFGGYSLEEKPKGAIHSAAHITGGGIPEKLGRALRASGCGAEITDSFTPSKLILHCQEIGNVSDEEAYKTWNMGNGMMIVTPDPEAVIATANNHNVNAKVVGKVTKGVSIKIRSKGHYANDNEWITY
jgi:phosphoribosylformylglycinamidine cyclo-ligase